MRSFVIFLLLTTFLFASVSEIEKKIYGIIIFSIFPKAQTVKVWTDDEAKRRLFATMQKIELVSSIQQADLIVLHSSELPFDAEALLFTDSYMMLKKYKERAIGGFFWQKGRPNVLFLEKSLKRYDIKLPKDMDEYIESSF